MRNNTITDQATAGFVVSCCYLRGMGARFANIVLGAWLFLTATLWVHTPWQRINAWSVGVLAVTGGLIALTGSRWGRYLNCLLGAWLILSTVLATRWSPVTFWNQIVVGFGLVLFALATDLAATRRHRTEDL